MNRALTSLLIAVVFSSAAACGSGSSVDPVSVAVGTVVAGKPVTAVDAAVWTDVQDFYKLRGGKSAWLGDKPTSKTDAAIGVLQSAREHGLAPDDYQASQLAQLSKALQSSDKDKDKAGRTQQLADLEVRVTTAMLSLGRDVAIGRTAPKRRSWKARRTAPDFADALNLAADDVSSWLEKVEPRHPEYKALREALKGLHGQLDAGKWQAVPAAKFKPGTSHPAVLTLRQRLAAGGHLTGESAKSSSSAYDTDLQAAVRMFQEHHAIKTSGVIDAPTLSALNVPLEDRIHQVIVNLERWRWMPDDLGAQHILVNIPYFHLMARENGQIVKDIRVVVGKVGHETPVFSGEMETVVFSPYWNIPDSIVEGETAPAMLKDSAYVARNNIEILRVSGTQAVPISSSSVNWDDADEVKRLVFRQRPGPDNALGHVKFLFPNEYNVYLHDTPADALFERTGRAYSHGCVRVEEPEELAKYILRGQAEWTESRIREAMHSGNEKHVKLKATVPVHIVYFTAWVDDKKGLHFQPDVYGYDGKK